MDTGFLILHSFVADFLHYRRGRENHKKSAEKSHYERAISTTETNDWHDCDTEDHFSIGCDLSTDMDNRLRCIAEDIARVVINTQDAERMDSERARLGQQSHLEKMSKLIVSGSFHQGDCRFAQSTRGKQCSANAAAALAMRAIKDPSLWNSDDVDAVLMAGDKLYAHSIRTRREVHPGEANPEFLAAEELSPDIEIYSEKCTLDVTDDVRHGHLTIDCTEIGCPNLKSQLDRFLDEKRGGILTCNSISVAVFHCGKTFWLFDSHSRSSAGEVISDGRACLLGFSNVDSLFTLLRKNIPSGRPDDPFSDNFNLTEVRMKREDFEDQRCTAKTDGILSTVNVIPTDCEMLLQEEFQADDSSTSSHSTNISIADPATQLEISSMLEEERQIEEHELQISADDAVDNELQDISTLERGVYSFSHVWNQLHEAFDKHEKGIECYFRNLRLVGYHRSGLKTLLRFRCTSCNYEASIASEPEDDSILDINQAAVLGSISAGIGHSQLEQVLAAMDVKCMVATTFRRKHDLIYDGLSKTAALEMKLAGEEERKLAIERGDVINGIAHIPVIADGSWMKRSYKLGKYDSPSGLGAIVGFHTQKVLFVGVRNKFCSVCDPALKKGETPREHTCYKNWGRDESSTSMEGDAILEGFKSSLNQHDLIYSTLIADGDSSVYKRITDFHPYREFDVYVKKVECGNHLIRNVGSKIKEIAKRKGIPGPIRKLIANSVPRFNIAIRKAVQHRLQQNDMSTTEKNKQLKRDILNAPSHIFGEHANCASLGYFCNGQLKVSEQNVVPELRRLGVFDALEDTVSRLSHHTNSLLHNVNNNAVESYNGVVAKFIGGKRINFGKRNSYNARTLGAAAQFNSKKILTRCREVMAKQPSPVASKMEANRERWADLQKKRKADAKANNTAARAESRPQTVDKDYGPSAQKPDLSEENYAIELARHNSRLTDLQQNRKTLERETIDQANNTQWMSTRRKLLTASKFGKVCLMRKDTSCKATVKSILYANTLQNIPAVDYGRKNEQTARLELEKQANVQIEECGLFVDPEILGLGASPDGLIGTDGIVEIKCPYSARALTPDEAIDQKNTSIRRIFKNSDGTEMNPNHEYYYQVQGQLHITQRDYCLFMMWTPKGSRIIKVTRDDKFWEEKMKHPLVQFYENCLVPEIVDGRFVRSMPIRDPPYILEAQAVAAKRKAENAVKLVAKRKEKEVSEREPQ